MDTNADEKLLAHLKNKWGNAKCPMCAASQWQVFSKVYAPPQFSKAGVVLGGEAIPVVPVVCTNCGFTAWVNAIIAGVLEQEGKKP